MAFCTKSNADTKYWSRKNGWSFPLHLLQFSAWLFIIMFALLYFGVLVPSLPFPWRISASLMFSVIFLIHTVVHLISISINPADPNVRAKNYRGPVPNFDRNQHAHVIENQFCYICEVKVGVHSKHCSACNKCISDFDHHCKWLNNCIGNRNYRLFITCVATALLGCLLVFVTCCTLVTAYFTANSWLHCSEQMQIIKTTSTLSLSSTETPVTESLTLNQTTPESSTQFYDFAPSNTTTNETIFYVFIPVDSILWIIVVILTSILSLIATGLLTHLLGFHIYLMCIGRSTYEFIVNKRDNEDSSSSHSFCHNFNCQGNFLKKLLLKKANQISPTNGKDVADDIEFAMKANAKYRNQTRTNGSDQVSIPVLEASVTKDNFSRDKSLENYLGNVYLGSPERQRHFLEPIYVNNRKTKRIKPEAESHMETALTGEKAFTNSVENSGHSLGVDGTSTNYNLSIVPPRKRHLTASPASILPPIMETENSETASSLSKWYRSVSAQSLNSLSDTDDFRTLSATKDGAILPGLAKRVNSSLSNLLFSMEESQEFNSEPNESDDEVSCQNYTQSTDTKDSDLYATNVSSSELINENEEDATDYAQNTTLAENQGNNQWANYVSQKLYPDESSSTKPKHKAENTIDDFKMPASSQRVEISRSSSQNDLALENSSTVDRRYSLSDKPPITKNNFFSAPLFRPPNHSKVIMIGNAKEEGLNESNIYYNQTNGLTENSEVTMFDSVVFDTGTQRSYSNITPLV